MFTRERMKTKAQKTAITRRARALGISSHPRAWARPYDPAGLRDHADTRSIGRAHQSR